MEKEWKYEPTLPWCRCQKNNGEPCTHCDQGSHERCFSPDCRYPKWSDVQDTYRR